MTGGRRRKRHLKAKADPAILRSKLKRPIKEATFDKCNNARGISKVHNTLPAPHTTARLLILVQSTKHAKFCRLFSSCQCQTTKGKIRRVSIFHLPSSKSFPILLHSLNSLLAINDRWGHRSSFRPFHLIKQTPLNKSAVLR